MNSTMHSSLATCGLHVPHVTLKSTVCCISTLSRRLPFEKAMEPKAKRRKIECLVCKKQFDSDHRRLHNERHHKNLLRSHKHIPFKDASAVKNPFEERHQLGHGILSVQYYKGLNAEMCNI